MNTKIKSIVGAAFVAIAVIAATLSVFSALPLDKIAGWFVLGLSVTIGMFGFWLTLGNQNLQTERPASDRKNEPRKPENETKLTPGWVRALWYIWMAGCVTAAIVAPSPWDDVILWGGFAIAFAVLILIRRRWYHSAVNPPGWYPLVAAAYLVVAAVVIALGLFWPYNLIVSLFATGLLSAFLYVMYRT